MGKHVSSFHCITLSNVLLVKADHKDVKTRRHRFRGIPKITVYYTGFVILTEIVDG